MKRFGVIFLVLLLFVRFDVFAQEASTSADHQKNAYTLPYPGILPDHPLYKLKVLRDRITALLINDPQKKVDFFLLQTDKQIAMVPMLEDKGKIELAKQTALKGEHNYTELVFVYRTKGTKPDSKTYKRLKTASRKHQEVLQNVMDKVKSEEDKKTFQQVINFSKTNEEQIDRLYNKGRIE